jgi:hypothetical protein
MSALTVQRTPYLPLVGRSGVALATLGWGLDLTPPGALRSAPPSTSRGGMEFTARAPKLLTCQKMRGLEHAAMG